MSDSLAAFASLLAPVSVETFLAQHYEHRWLHVPHEGARTPLVTLAAVCDAVVADGGRAGGVEVFAEHFEGGRFEGRTIVADGALLAAYLAAGHPLVWSRARAVFASVDALCGAMGRALGARVWPNVYVTGTAGTPFDMHFDAHEVIVAHCEGAKEWTLSEVRADRPTDDDPQPEVMARRRAEAKGRVAARFTVAAGDVVYVPRGVFHNARAVGGPSVHVTFGIRGLTGHDVARVLAARALGDRELRGYAPPPGDDAAMGEWLREVVLRLGEHLLDEGLEGDVARARAGIVRG